MVIDLTVILPVIFNLESKSKILQHTAGKYLIAPYSLKYEFTRTVCRLSKNNYLSYEEVVNVINIFKNFDINYKESDEEKSFALCFKFGVTCYEANQLQLAKEENSIFFSLNKQLNKIAKSIQLKTLTL